MAHNYAGFQRALTRAVNVAAGTRRTGKSVHRGLTAVVAVFLPFPAWCGSSKDRIANPEAESAVHRVVYAGMRDYFAAHPG